MTCKKLADAFAAHGREIAGVIVEPIAGNMGLVTPSAEFLTALRPPHGTTRGAAHLRRSDDRPSAWHSVGAQELLKQRPDLTVLGKIVGGGFPVGRLWRPGGRDEKDHAGGAGLHRRDNCPAIPWRWRRDWRRSKSCVIRHPTRDSISWPAF